MTLGFRYPKGDNFKIVGHFDADYAGYKVQMKSISGPGDFQPFIPKETDFTSSSEKGWDNHSISSRDRRLKNFVTIPLISWFLVVSLGA